MTLAITGLYAALLTAFFLLLTFRVIAYRRGQSISLGSGGDEVMERRVRAQGNFAETVPLALILLAVAEVQGEGAVWLHAMGGMLTLGRVMHGANFTFDLRQMPLRVGGMVLTLLAMILGAGLALPL